MINQFLPDENLERVSWSAGDHDLIRPKAIVFDVSGIDLDKLELDTALDYGEIVRVHRIPSFALALLNKAYKNLTRGRNFICYEFDHDDYVMCIYTTKQ